MRKLFVCIVLSLIVTACDYSSFVFQKNDLDDNTQMIISGNCPHILIKTAGADDVNYYGLSEVKNLIGSFYTASGSSLYYDICKMTDDVTLLEVVVNYNGVEVYHESTTASYGSLDVSFTAP